MQIAILDAGAQYGKVIDRRVRELGIESILLPLDTPVAELQKFAALIISGGPQSVYGADAPKFDPQLINLNKPILGICYGMQLLVHAAGGTVTKEARREDGPCEIVIKPESALFGGLHEKQNVLMSHGDTVTLLPNGYTVIGDSNGLVAAIENPVQKRYAVQFHPEVDLTENGQKILENFLCKIAAVPATYTLLDREQLAIEYIQKTVGSNTVLILVSGGVDSTVCAALIRKALPAQQILALHIDSGMMRYQESAAVKAALESLGLKLLVVDAFTTFQNATTVIGGKVVGPLKTITDPQEKRKIIGDTFIKIAKDYLQTLHLDLDSVFLAQGTLRPDLIESASSHISKNASVIKTHHNDTDVVRALRDRGRVIEPLAEYHKDEVRKLGEQLGLPAEIVWRQPFPGPGLGIRILCATTPYLTDTYDAVLQKLQSIVPEPYAVTLLPIRSVGVQGDGRTYSYVAALSCNTSYNALELHDWENIMQLARELPKHVHEINRVAYMFGPAVSKSIKSITPTFISEGTIDQLQHADKAVSDTLFQYDLLTSLSQVPVISIPVDVDSVQNPTKHSIVIRTFITNDFMTGVPATPHKEMPAQALKAMIERIEKDTPNLSRILYDLTSKPPGTTEWE
jgi:GMP synthase (glutamine-hydrolysing)